MAEFKKLSNEERKKLDDLLKAADTVLSTDSVVIESNPDMAKAVGNAIGGVTGASIAAGTLGGLGAAGVGAAGVGAAGATMGLGGLGAAGIIGLTPFVAPVAVVGLLGMFIFGNKKKKEKQEEAQRQTNYCKDIVAKMQKILDKYVAVSDEDIKGHMSYFIDKRENKKNGNVIYELSVSTNSLSFEKRDFYYMYGGSTVYYEREGELAEFFEYILQRYTEGGGRISEYLPFC